jgi:tryptophan-rich sensory protein
MAIAAWLVWRRAGISGARLALVLFAIQLLFNVGWSAIFFSAHMPGVAFAEIILLWLMILATIVSFWPVSRAAGWLLLPYLLWVSFAAALNYSIWRLNA